MAAGFKKILIEGDAAALSTATPALVGTTTAPGSATDASKSDHVHEMGVGAIDNANQFGAGVVDAAAIATDAVDSAEIKADAVAAAEISDTATDITFAQVILKPAASGTGTGEGTIYYDSDDDHAYIYTGT